MTEFRLLGALALVLAPPALAASECDANAGPCMERSAARERPAVVGPSDRFTGTVTVRPIFDARPPGRTSAGEVRFAPGARSAWHRHPLGQHLIVTSGLGWTQVEGGPIVEMHPGDVIWCPPGVKHWHGATPTTSVTHIAVQEAEDGTNVVWLEKVSDAEYRVRR